MSYIVDKMHTLVDTLDHPRFFGKLRRGIIPTTFCKLDSPWLTAYGFRTILDIGANVGRFSITANAAFPEASIEAFEPLPNCFAEASKALKSYSQVRLHHCALGDAEAELNMFANDFSPSSSLLPMAEAHKEAFPFTGRGKTVPVRVRRLDDLAASLSIQEPLFVKIDVQGFEQQVLRGGSETIARAKVVLLELSFEELYKDQPLFADLFDAMRSLGFHFRGTMAQMAHPKDGRTLDADCFFVKA